jgi:FixJ family two-component response regulator
MAPETRPAYVRDMSASSGMQTPLIAIVDDDEAIRQSVSGLVRSAGFRTAIFASAEALLRSGLLEDAACLIVDLWMPRVSGLELQKRMGALSMRIPIIFATGHADREAQEKAMQDGAVAFLHKPFCDEALLAAMRLALREKSAE